jgi:hypothetical protein
MFEELKKYLEVHEVNFNAWYDDTIDFIRDYILSEFRDDDWDALEDAFPKGDTTFKIRLAEILDESDNPHAIKILLRMVDTDDEEVAFTCIETLKDFDLSQLPNESMTFLIEKDKSLIPTASRLQKMILIDFLNIHSKGEKIFNPFKDPKDIKD